MHTAYKPSEKMRKHLIALSLFSMLVCPCNNLFGDKPQNNHNKYFLDEYKCYRRKGTESIRPESYMQATFTHFDSKKIYQIFENHLSQERLRQLRCDYIFLQFHHNAIKQKVVFVTFRFYPDNGVGTEADLTDQEMTRIEKDILQLQFEYSIADRRKINAFSRYNLMVRTRKLLTE